MFLKYPLSCSGAVAVPLGICFFFVECSSYQDWKDVIYFKKGKFDSSC